MKGKKGPFRRIRLVFRRTSPLVQCAILAMLLLSVVALLTLRNSIRSEKQKQKELEQSAAQLQLENAQLTKQIAELGTVESVKRIATLNLGLVDPDSQFFTPSEEP